MSMVTFVNRVRESLPQIRFVWCAAEFARMRGLRDYVRRERGVGLEDRYVSSYWMLGRTEEGHKVEKREDVDRDREGADARSSGSTPVRASHDSELAARDAGA